MANLRSMGLTAIPFNIKLSSRDLFKSLDSTYAAYSITHFLVIISLPLLHIIIYLPALTATDCFHNNLSILDFEYYADTVIQMKLHYYTDMIIQICPRHAQCQLEIILSALSQLTRSPRAQWATIHNANWRLSSETSQTSQTGDKQTTENNCGTTEQLNKRRTGNPMAILSV